VSSNVHKFDDGFDFGRATEDERAAFDWGFEAGRDPARMHWEDVESVLDAVLTAVRRLRREAGEQPS
jgi:hypothetical protein